jgi:molybdopterin-guanine dinucleotide biosynthesis protein A
VLPARDVTIVILAGGLATRFPGKLEHEVGGMPLLARVYRNLRGAAPVLVAGRQPFSAPLDALLDCPIVIDRWPARGPLAALVSALEHVATPYLFAAAGDAPNLTHDVFDAALGAWRDGDEAVVPEHDGRLEPLAALYACGAIAREGTRLLEDPKPSMHALLDRLSARRVRLDGRYFANVNTSEDLSRL